MPATAWVRSRMAAVISSGVKTTGAVVGGVQAAEETGPDAARAAPAEVVGGAAVVVVGRADDMIDPEQSDTKLVESADLPDLGRSL